MTCYNQGRADQKRLAGDKLFRRAMFIGVAIVVVAGMAVIALSGCATTLVKKGTLVELKQPLVLSGLVQVAQMGTECRNGSEEREVARIVRETMAANGALAPDIIKIRLLSGSSLCGPAQGVADVVGTPDYGAYSTARAQVSLYWKGGITEGEFARAERAFNLLRAKSIRPSSKVAHTPAAK